MTIWNLFSLVGGLAVFLYGMIIMNKNLTSIAGDKLKKLMLKLTKGKVRGYFTGLGITMVNQSSSATTVLEAALVGAGLMTFQQSLAVTLGAELGSTFLPQLVAFPSITKFSTIIIAFGFFYSLLAKNDKSRHIALTILGFGLLFMGMDMMSGSLTPLRSYAPFLDLMVKIEEPALGILVGLFFTMIVQSSGATTGLTIAMAMSGTISLSQAVPINLGAAVGTCITAVLGSLALNREAKRSAYIHIVFQTIGVIIVYLLLCVPFRGERLYIYFVKWFTLNVLHTDSLARQIAMAFTFMPVINHIIVFPMLNLIVKVFDKAYPPMEEEKAFGPKYIGEQFIGTPEIALEMAKKEILRVAKIVNAMFEDSHKAISGKDLNMVRDISERDTKADILHNAIIPFLAKLSEKEIDTETSKKEINYLYIVNEFESIGDVIDKNIMVLAKKMIEKNMNFSEEGSRELDMLHGRISKNIEKIVEAFAENNKEFAQNIKKELSEINEDEFKAKHIKRLHSGLKESLETSSVHLDLISYLNRINNHVSYVADMLIQTA